MKMWDLGAQQQGSKQKQQKMMKKGHAVHTVDWLRAPKRVEARGYQLEAGRPRGLEAEFSWDF